MCRTCFQGLLQAVVVAPVLWVSLLEVAVHLCGFLHALQPQQQLPCERKGREGGEHTGAALQGGRITAYRTWSRMS